MLRGWQLLTLSETRGPLRCRTTLTAARRHLEVQQPELVFQRGGSGVDGHLPLDPPQPDPLAE